MPEVKTEGHLELLTQNVYREEEIVVLLSAAEFARELAENRGSQQGLVAILVSVQMWSLMEADL